VTLYTLGKKSNVNGSSSWPWFTQNCQWLLLKFISFSYSWCCGAHSNARCISSHFLQNLHYCEFRLSKPAGLTFVQQFFYWNWDTCWHCADSFACFKYDFPHLDVAEYRVIPCQVSIAYNPVSIDLHENYRYILDIME
jgi:hypothetical protein